MEYILTRKKGMKNIRIRISNDGRVLVSAPYYASRIDIDRFVSEKEDWIKENITKAIEKNSTHREVGKELTFLGKSYKLVFEKGNSGEYSIIDDRIILFTNRDIGEQERISLICNFFGSESLKIIPPIFEKYLTKSGYKGRPFSIVVKLLKSKWGSCNLRSSRFTFNILLLKLPLEFVEYTVAHEVTHLFVKGHGKDFYDRGEMIFTDFFATDRLMNKYKNVNILD